MKTGTIIEHWTRKWKCEP